MNTLTITLTITLISVCSFLHALTIAYNDYDEYSNVEQVQSILDQFDDLSSVQKLTVSNSLMNDTSWVKDLTNAEELTLSHNFIQDVPCLDKNTRLKKLNLSHNIIKRITNIYCSNIEYVDLSHNLISGDIVLGNGRQLYLKGINLSFNKITAIINIPDCPALRGINVSHNLLIALPDFSRCKQLETVVCSYTNIDSLEPITQVKSIKTIHAVCCPNLKDISCLFFKRDGSDIVECVLPELSVFDVSLCFLDDKSRALVQDILNGHVRFPMYINGTLVIPQRFK